MTRSRKGIHVPPPVEPLPSAINTFEDFCMFMVAWINYMYRKYRMGALKKTSLISILLASFKFGILSLTL